MGQKTILESTASQPMPQIQVNVQQSQMMSQVLMMQNKKEHGHCGAAFFGTLSLLHASVIGGVVMVVLSLIIGFLTLRLGFIITCLFV
ncbi:MAG: hypothetical protein E7198_11030 [Schwartzia succinivorans]|uniref:hypothetical protein n=1 Tax=Schwartzia succinivorans TaxID=55507 RepID=UPI002354BA49|nr:hypothetical protein [Schwartzia succinivorans]MBE6098299.1 hypothetical protein [Schwartzia succinivorans]